MRYQHAKSKVAGGKPKYVKHNCEKWSANVISASQKPHYKSPFVQDQSYFRIDNKKHRFFPQKTTSVEASPLCAPHAPRNTTSYIIRAKNSGGIINTSSPSPSPSPSTPIPASTGFVTPPYNEGVVEQVNPEWGVDSYGSMKGLLKVRHVNHQANDFDPNLDKCVEILDENLERRLDQDLSRFEMVYLSNNETVAPQILEIRINDQDNQIAYLEEESTILKERVHSMEQELDSLKRRMRVLEGANAFRLGEVCSGEASFA